MEDFDNINVHNQIPIQKMKKLINDQQMMMRVFIFLKKLKFVITVCTTKHSIKNYYVSILYQPNTLRKL